MNGDGKKQTHHREPKNNWPAEEMQRQHGDYVEEKTAEIDVKYKICTKSKSDIDLRRRRRKNLNGSPSTIKKKHQKEQLGYQQWQHLILPP